MENKIIIKSPLRRQSLDKLAGKIAVTPEAELLVKRLAEDAGVSIRYMASEIIVQAADFIEIEYRI